MLKKIMKCGGIIYLKSGVNNYLGVFIMLKNNGMWWHNLYKIWS